MSFSFAFFGTPQLSADILEILKRHGLVPSVIVTNPDRPQGRKMALTPPPVKLWALANTIPCLQPEKLNEPEFLGQLSTVKCQLFIVVAYGSILPKKLLAIPEKGSLNIHYSLLPKYRGASPIESQILADDKDVGVSILLLDEEMDHGPMVAERRLQFPISNSQFLNTEAEKKLEWPVKASELRSAMNSLAGEMLADVMPRWMDGKIEAKPQDHSKATYTKKFTKADGEINVASDPYANFLKIQAYDDSIGTYFFMKRDGKKVRVSIKSAEFKDETLVILRVVPEGRKEMDYEAFLRSNVYSPLGQAPR